MRSLILEKTETRDRTMDGYCLMIIILNRVSQSRHGASSSMGIICSGKYSLIFIMEITAISTWGLVFKDNPDDFIFS